MENLIFEIQFNLDKILPYANQLIGLTFQSIIYGKILFLTIKFIFKFVIYITDKLTIKYYI